MNTFTISGIFKCHVSYCLLYIFPLSWQSGFQKPAHPARTCVEVLPVLPLFVCLFVFNKPQKDSMPQFLICQFWNTLFPFQPKHPDYLMILLFTQSLILQTFSPLYSSSSIAETQLSSPTRGRGEIAGRKGATGIVYTSKHTPFGCPGRFPCRLIQAWKQAAQSEQMEAGRSWNE